MKKDPCKTLFVFLLINLCLITHAQAQETGAPKIPTYTPNAIKVFEDGTYLTGAEEIQALWAGLNNKIREYEVLENIPSHIPDRIRYELSRIALADGQVLQQLIIWNVEKAVPRRELEIAVESEPLNDYILELDARRAEWMRLCNAHNAGELVNNLYTANSLYYNDGPIVSGRKAIASAYSYMNDPAYSLSLTPMRVVAVSSQIAFEIGQCSGSYGGKYVLVWQLGQDGKWRILLDSNV